MHVATDGVLELGGSAIALIEDLNQDASNALASGSPMAQSFVDHLPTKTTYTYSFNLLGKPGEASHAAILPGAELTLAWYPDGNATGKEKHAVTVVLSSVGDSWSASSVTKKSVSASSRGVPAITTLP